MIQAGLLKFLASFPGRRWDPVLADDYNTRIALDFERIRDFIILHYHANQRDEPLWRQCREMTIPESLAQRIALFAARGKLSLAAEEMFTVTSWQAVMQGQGVHPAAYDPLVDLHDPDRMAAEFEKVRREIEAAAAGMPRHIDALAGAGR